MVLVRRDQLYYATQHQVHITQTAKQTYIAAQATQVHKQTCSQTLNFQYVFLFMHLKTLSTYTMNIISRLQHAQVHHHQLAHNHQIKHSILQL